MQKDPKLEIILTVQSGAPGLSGSDALVSTSGTYK